jgi:hypothetical protein
VGALPPESEHGSDPDRHVDGMAGPTDAVPEPSDRLALIGGIDREALADPERREAEIDRIALAMFRAIEGRDPVIEPSGDD